MLISPPFLLARNANETDDDWINRCMVGGQPGDGAFPLSHAMQWHGGMHLNEPEANASVRVIADGEVVYLRQPIAQPAGPLQPEHAQSYRGGWTDNGVVVVRHDTEIGEGVNGAVTYFSIYMHLRHVEAAVQLNRRIYRKAKIGLAGQIYSQPGKLHFEIVCDDANLVRLAGRTSGELHTSANGRTDAIYGEMYFHLPAGTLVFDQQPIHNNPVAHRQPPRPAPKAAWPAPVPLAHIRTTAAALIVGMRYAGGEGAIANRGDVHLSTCQLDGTPIGTPLREPDAEYNIYKTANTICDAYPANARPAPSAVYELLRFGRVIGPDTLTPSDVPHWRKINDAAGSTGWVNLNAPGITKFSDADFPHWKGWSLIDDSADQDSRCDSATVKGWLDSSGDGKVTPAEASARMAGPEVARRLARAVCKLPTEWNAATTDQRMGWVRTSTLENPAPLDSDNFERLRKHIASLAFWPGGMGLPDSHWHWQPKEFIQHLRLCGWLSLSEMVQFIPASHPDNSKQIILTSVASAWLTTAGSNPKNGGGRPAGMFNAINLMMRKYGIASLLRRSHLFGQILTESDLLQTTKEYGNATYFNNAYEGRCNLPVTRTVKEWGPNPITLSPLGNCQPGDGPKFIGRGVIQMTGRELYEKYGAYRGVDFTTGSNYLDISDDAFNACDSAGQYWVKENLRDKTPARKWILRGEININRDADSANFLSLGSPAQQAATDANVLILTQQINRAAFHIAWRRSFFKHAYYHSSDLIDAPPIEFKKRKL